MAKQNVVHTFSGILLNILFNALKSKKTVTHAITWVNHENIITNEISQSQKAKYCMIPFK